jgi:branched-chain amino acid aminotransferase
MENIDWKNLPFGYMKTDYNVRCYYRNGKWGELETSSSEFIMMHMAATTLHYGQEVFEGLKAYRGKDGKIRLFRCRDNAQRMVDSGSYIQMAVPPVELFVEAVKKAVKLNEHFVPPYESGATLYVRPLLIGTGAEIGVKPGKEYLFMVFVAPVGPYFKTGFKPLDVMITRTSDRAAPLGTGHVKVGGNYAASLFASFEAQQLGFSTCLYLDAKEKKYIDECGPANFFGIKNNTYVTPDSKSILPSITNRSLITLAEDMGMKVERRPVEVSELETFEETGACGTAAVITPVGKIFDPQTNRIYEYGNEAGPVSAKLYNLLRAIQYGDAPDTHNWVEFVD